MNFKNSIKTCFKKYAKFKGRASRYEFWYFTLFFYGVIGLICLIAYFEYLYQSTNRSEFQSDDSCSLVVNYLKVIFCFTIVTLLPFLTVTVRRLHDINKSGKWVVVALLFTILSAFIPYAGLLSLIINLIIFVMCLSYGNRKNNDFGKNIY